MSWPKKVSNTCRFLGPLRKLRTREGQILPSQYGLCTVESAERVGLSAETSAHWLRHAHASHSLNRGAPIHLGR
jgi:integrase/recombinase XerD